MLTPSIVVNDPVVTRLAPTPDEPLLYDTVPPVAVANVPVVAAFAAVCTCNPEVAAST